MRRHADDLLAQERQQFESTRRGDRARVERDLRVRVEFDGGSVVGFR